MLVRLQLQNGNVQRRLLQLTKGESMRDVRQYGLHILGGPLEEGVRDRDESGAREELVRVPVELLIEEPEG